MNASPLLAAWPQTILRVWIILWVLAVPLFHVHPDTVHQHGAAGHVHGGMVHTVFSPDLDGEFDRRPDFPPPDQASVSGVPAQASDYTELGFSFVSDTTDRTLPKPAPAFICLAGPPAHHAVNAPSTVVHHVTPSYPVTLLSRDIPSRGPPSLLV